MRYDHTGRYCLALGGTLRNCPSLWAKEQAANSMGQTYTIAYTPHSMGEILHACLPDGGDLEAALSAVEQAAHIEIDRDMLVVTEGLHLTDWPEEGEEEVWSGSTAGCLTDTQGRTWKYAVRRTG